MTEEPYRWLEAVANRRDYVREQLKGGSPVFAASLPDGILLLGVGSGQSKVFELFDRQAMAGLGHPADIEKIRQAAIDAAHVEAFTRAPEDVSLRRLVSFGLSGQLKTNFEQIFSAPFLIELLLAELGHAPENDLFFRLHYDGSFQTKHGGVMVCASNAEIEGEIQRSLAEEIKGNADRKKVADLMLQAWWCLMHGKSFAETTSAAERQEGWRSDIKDKVIELGWLARNETRIVRFELLSASQLGL
jgi:proteasome alpha subunit